MGKRYYCDYCDKTMPGTSSIIKTHNSGLVHQKIVNEHYQKFKDPEVILAEESRKKPCSRFAKGECQFGAICKFSHYTREQLDSLHHYVSTRNLAEAIVLPNFQDLYDKLQDEKSKSSPTNTTILVENSGITHLLPWTYNEDLDGYDLPPSIKRLAVDNFKDVRITEWG